MDRCLVRNLIIFVTRGACSQIILGNLTMADASYDSDQDEEDVAAVQATAPLVRVLGSSTYKQRGWVPHEPQSPQGRVFLGLAM
jgi:hypothetical protein